jgi:hypothetical protein
VKRRYLLLGLLLLLMLVLLAAVAGPASAKALKTDFTTTSDSSYIIDPLIWPSGPLVGHQRDGVIEAHDLSSDPRLTGTTYLTEDMDVRFDAKTGILWLVGRGTWRTEVYTVDGPGTWEGTFTEVLQVALDANGDPIPALSFGSGRSEGRGVAGSVAGLQVRSTTEVDPLAGTVTATGYIIEP